MLASHHVVHAESPTHPLIRTEPNRQSARMTTCLPDMHATPRSTPTQITLRPARRAIRSASPTCVHSELICSTWKYCTPSRDPRHPICMPTRSARRADLQSDPLPTEPFCTSTRSARRFAIFTSRDLLAYRCTPIVCFDPTRSARRAELHTEPICTPTRSAFVLRPDLLSTRSAVDPICT